MTGDGSFGVAVKAAIVDGPRLLVLYKTREEALGDPDPDPERQAEFTAAYRCARSPGAAQLTVEPSA